MKKYKIGAVTKLLNLSEDTLRYYESRGFVTPQKDEDSGYRYYDAWDLNFLLDSIWYRSFDFPLKDVMKMLNEDNAASFADRCAKRQVELLRTICAYKQKLDALARFREKILRMKKHIGVLEISERPEKIYQKHRVKDDFIFDEDVLDLIKKWLTAMPLPDHTFIIPRYAESDAKRFSEYQWGFSLPPDIAIQNGLDVSPPAEYFPRVKSVYTVFTANERRTFLDSFQNKVVAEIHRMGYKIADRPMGNLIVRLHEEDGFTRYFEVWTPIE
ncbi:MAG: MerR family transcriptional regulator [Clostridiales Family XIII bacterium]|jgi:DNA-binding transcriptional MerR regulator|nr:MerR family transcriptional regulator [Clostridiales Family XIII bacterium]